MRSRACPANGISSLPHLRSGPLRTTTVCGRVNLPMPQSAVCTISTSAVFLALAKTLPGHRAEPLAAACRQPYVADHHEIRLNLLGEAGERVYRITQN